MVDLDKELNFDIDDIIYHMQQAGMDVHKCAPGETPGFFDENGQPFKLPSFEEMMGYDVDINDITNSPSDSWDESI